MAAVVGQFALDLFGSLLSQPEARDALLQAAESGDDKTRASSLRALGQSEPDEHIIAKLNAEGKRAFQAPDVVQRVTREGAEIVANSPEEFNSAVRAEYAKWRELVKRQGIKGS